MHWLLIAIILFIALPLDAQYALAGGVRWVVLSPYGPYVLAGAVAGLIVVMAGYSIIWNQAMESIFREDLKKADEAYRRRKK